MTLQDAIAYIQNVLENAVNCTGPERDRLRLAVKIIKEAVLDKKEEASGG